MFWFAQPHSLAPSGAASTGTVSPEVTPVLSAARMLWVEGKQGLVTVFAFFFPITGC